MAAMSILELVPLLSVLGLMVFRRWGAHQAGLAGWLAGLVIAAGWFGLTPQVWWVSQAKGLLLRPFSGASCLLHPFSALLSASP